jgi:hypothetical protein
MNAIFGVVWNPDGKPKITPPLSDRFRCTTTTMPVITLYPCSPSGNYLILVLQNKENLSGVNLVSAGSFLQVLKTTAVDSCLVDDELNARANRCG